MSTRTPVGPPRLMSPYFKLLHRFFEPLVLLRVLGKTRGLHSTIPKEYGTPSYWRRDFLENLSYLCDHTKGGSTTTAIGLEERDDCYVFWVAHNEQKSSKIMPFVESVLEDVRSFLSLPQDKRASAMRQLIDKCIEFANPRVKKEVKILKTNLAQSKKFLTETGSAADLELKKWLEMFDGDNDAEICCLAYRNRRSPQMTDLKERSHARNEGSNQTDPEKAFGDTRHFLGRLGSHFGAPIKIIKSSLQLKTLFDSYFVRTVESTPPIQSLQPDNQTTLRGILRRMESSMELDKNLYEDALMFMNDKFGIEEKVLEQYEQAKPCVHAEIQVLEHFYLKNLEYASDDRYIGCSKPACYCCLLYIRHHPARCVEPGSHNNIYLNWSPPALKFTNVQDQKYIQQRKVLQKMLETIRKDALDQIKQREISVFKHADSQTGITASVMSDMRRTNRQNSLEEDFAGLGIDSADLKVEVNDMDNPRFEESFSDTESSPNEQSDGSSGWVPAYSQTAQDDESDSEGGASL
ncbi:uncharacterized protein BCR38DRAFT_481788 [Pseudomassariella vexata]|uniref:Uncharacterized protein n=1 Tax=Pseudomassariella vexata TaxID=1141098 RepID=A0A1Y2EA87_9PEZI|nr:uncharacterized protein BCR38DRAFT_481788 [Pseudomassariella vexata]ORY68307.1 hypothetical protein BCR38DRAFT_481788 [Pseudomassariella vexata]